MAEKKNMSWCPDQIDQLLKRYRKWAVSNPQSLVEIEGCVKMGSYLLAGKLLLKHLKYFYNIFSTIN